jgi:hypothetical protein
MEKSKHNEIEDVLAYLMDLLKEEVGQSYDIIHKYGDLFIVGLTQYEGRKWREFSYIQK